MDITKINAAANKALIAAHPQYHAWTSQRQETFRATMDKAAKSRVDIVLLNDLLGIQCNAETAGDIWDDLPLPERNKLNWAKLLTTGIGDDMIMLNEPMADNISLLDFETLYDYDFADHLFQEAAKKEIRDYQGRDYYALRFDIWARLLIDNQFYYASLNSLAGFLTDHIEDKGEDMIQTLIPHEYIEGKEHGKLGQGGFLWDMKIDANGLEKQLEELKSRWRHYTQQRWLALSREFAGTAPAVYMEDQSDNQENHRNFIFNNEHVLKRTRWRHFLSDCEAIQADYAEVAELEQQELVSAESWLQKNYEDIMENFDPKVIPLRKKRKVVVAPGVFDELFGEDEDE